MRRILGAMIIAFVSLLIPTQSASASGYQHYSPGTTLAAMWKLILMTPSTQGPFGGGDTCLHFAGVVAAFGQPPATGFRCEVSEGTPVFVVVQSSECSNVEAPPYHGVSASQQRRCAVTADSVYFKHSLRVDGKSVAVTEVSAPQIAVEAPPDPVIGTAGQTLTSSAHGWVALLCRLSPGKHTLEITLGSLDAKKQPVFTTIPTVFIVGPRHH